MSRPRKKLIGVLKENLPRGSRLLVAVSGGIDSMSLLHGCLALRQLHRTTLEVAHVDHGLRPASAAEADFVAAAASAGGLPFHLYRAQAKPLRVNTEAWARRIRYRFFRQILDERKLDWVLTAHTANDSAETLLMRLVANKELRSIQARDLRRRCLRPLLGVERREIESYARRHELSFVEDESNDDLRFLRNKVRHVLLPFLEREFDPRMVEVLARRAQALTDDERALGDQAAAAMEVLQGLEFGSKAWFRAACRLMADLAPALQYRVVERLFREQLGFSLGRQQCRLLIGLFLKQAVAVELPGKLAVRRRGGGVLVEGPAGLRIVSRK